MREETFEHLSREHPLDTPFGEGWAANTWLITSYLQQVMKLISQALNSFEFHFHETSQREGMIDYEVQAYIS